MPTPVKQAKPARDHSLDFLRGSAVLFMVIAHVNAVFYDKPGTILDTGTWWGATVCFTIFLFVSASVTGIQIKLDKFLPQKVLKRSFSLLIVYFATAFVLTLLNTDTDLTLRTAIDILTFKNVPEFTEFLIPFFIYPILILPIWKPIGKLLKQPAILISISLFIYLLGIYLYQLNWGAGYVNTIKGLLVGHEDIHWFGLLLYFPVYAIGLAWGGRENTTESKSQTGARNALFATVPLFVLTAITGISTWQRYPPSISFILYGLIFSFAVILIYRYAQKISILNSAFKFLGVHALAYYVYHIIFIAGMDSIISIHNVSEFATIMLYLLTLSICTIVIVIVQKMKANLSSPH